MQAVLPQSNASSFFLSGIAERTLLLVNHAHHCPLQYYKPKAVVRFG